MLKKNLVISLIGVMLLFDCKLPPSYLSCSNPKSTGTWPYDMMWCQEDPDNGWPLNPGYYGGPFQDPAQTNIKHEQTQGYAHDVYFTNGTWCGPFMVYNKTVMFTGTIYWSSHSSDDDYNMDLLTPLLSGVSQQVENKLGITPLLHLEFDSDETIDHYDGNPWWKAFHQAVDGGDQAAHYMVDGLQAIVIGRWVMDCAFGTFTSFHGCRAEVHPVLGLAIQTKATPKGPGVEEWQFFLRGRGNQGYCGDDDITGIWKDTVFRFPGRSGPAQVDPLDIWVNKSRVDFDLKWDGDDLLLICDLPYTSDWIVGTIRITYQ